jgi:hypothetical protein
MKESIMFRKVALGVFCGAAIALLGGCGSEPKVEAAAAANIGDEVSISPVEIICVHRDEAEQLWYVGEMAMAQSRRMGEGTWASVRNASDERLAAMRTLRSCQRGIDSNMRFRVVAKEIDHNAKTVTYGLYQQETQLTGWLVEKAHYHSPFKNVRKPNAQPATKQADSTQPAAAKTGELKSLDYGVEFKRPVMACVDPEKHDSCSTLKTGTAWAAWHVPAASVPSSVKNMPAGSYAFCLTGKWKETPTTCLWIVVRPADDVLRYWTNEDWKKLLEKQRS